MKSLRVTTVSPYGDMTIDHPMGEVLTEEEYMVAILKGVTNAESLIKSFEIVEV